MKLPKLWRDAFSKMDPQDLGNILIGKETKHILPLSFLSLLKCISSLSIPRYGTSEYKNTPITAENVCGNHPKLNNLFLKHVKLKKRHEISLMSDFVYHTAKQCECNGVLDFGSGLGHLVRILTYKYNLSTMGIEMQTKLSEEARYVIGMYINLLI